MQKGDENFSDLFDDVVSSIVDCCPKCSVPMTFADTKEPISLDDGVTVYARIPTHSCEQCGLVVLSPDAEEIRDAAVRLHLGLLTSSEVKSVRSALGLSRREFSDAYGIPSASMERWENGRLLQNRSSDTLLRALRNPAIARTLDRRFSQASVSAYQGENVIQLRALKTSPDRAKIEARSAEFLLRRI